MSTNQVHTQDTISLLEESMAGCKQITTEKTRLDTMYLKEKHQKLATFY